MSAYYNEHDPKAAAILRQYIADGLIAPGDVDERSIEDVSPAELVGYTQWHFFAGGGFWSAAARAAGWPDDRPLRTGSLPCQPFSAAGKGEGFADERHLLPAFAWHVEFGAPCPMFGEQVSSDDGLAWLDALSLGMEDAGYALGAHDLCAAGFGAPHIRQRLYWMAYPDVARLEGRQREQQRAGELLAGKRGLVDGLGDTGELGRGKGWIAEAGADNTSPIGGGDWFGSDPSGSTPYGGCCADRLDDSASTRYESAGRRQPQESESWERLSGLGRKIRGDCGGVLLGRDANEHAGHRALQGVSDRPGPANGFWGDCDWLLCRPEPGYPNGRWRPVESGTFPLAHGYPGRVPLLRLAGNSICLPQATAFIRAGIEELTSLGMWTRSEAA